jgi:hypothetical protein
MHGERCLNKNWTKIIQKIEKQFYQILHKDKDSQNQKKLHWRKKQNIFNGSCQIKYKNQNNGL